MEDGRPTARSHHGALVSLLNAILTAKRAEISRLRSRRLPAEPSLRVIQLKRQAHEPLRLLAEIKLRSPSAGPLSRVLSVSERAAAYERGGASLVSVLCDEGFFEGSYEHLGLARTACSLPILCKEFIIDELQLDWARAFGADAVLLIARCLPGRMLGDLLGAALTRGLLPLVEIANLDEARRALEVDASVIGVNARDLDTLQMDPERARTVLEFLPEAVTRVHLSGIKTADDIFKLSRTGADAALVGEALMRLDNPEPLLSCMVQASRNA